MEDNFRDDEIRVLGSKAKQDTLSATTKGLAWYHILGIVLAILVAIAALIFIPFRKEEKGEEIVEEYFENQLTDSSHVTSPELTIPEKIGDYSISDRSYTEHLTQTVNDIPLDIYIPHNAQARLYIGTPDLNDKNIIFTTQAADIRADNGKINGAFVINGTPKAWGLSKKGYCAVVDSSITVGMADNSPLFERATVSEGHFFRQYPLVSDGKIIESELRGKSIRKSICDRKGEILIVMTQTKESFHDFSQALIDMGVDQAIYLVGGTSYGYYRDLDSQTQVIYPKIKGGQRYENHIQWVIKP